MSRSQMFLTVRQVADQLQVDPRTISRWIAKGDLVAHKLGGSVRVSEEDLRAFLALRRGS